MVHPTRLSAHHLNTRQHTSIPNVGHFLTHAAEYLSITPGMQRRLQLLLQLLAPGVTMSSWGWTCMAGARTEGADSAHTLPSKQHTTQVCNRPPGVQQQPLQVIGCTTHTLAGLSSAVFGHAWTWEGSGGDPPRDPPGGPMMSALWKHPHPVMLSNAQAAAHHAAVPKVWGTLSTPSYERTTH